MTKRMILSAILIVLFSLVLALPASAALPNANYDFNGIQRGGTSSIGALDYSDGSTSVAVVAAPQNLRVVSYSNN